MNVFSLSDCRNGADLFKWIYLFSDLLRAEQNYEGTVWWRNFNFSSDNGVVDKLYLDLSKNADSNIWITLCETA